MSECFQGIYGPELFFLFFLSRDSLSAKLLNISVQIKPGFGIGIQNQDQVSVSVSVP